MASQGPTRADRILNHLVKGSQQQQQQFMIEWSMKWCGLRKCFLHSFLSSKQTTLEMRSVERIIIFF